MTSTIEGLEYPYKFTLEERFAFCPIAPLSFGRTIFSARLAKGLMDLNLIV